MRGPTGGDVVFERDGSFWAFGASTSDAMLVHFDAFDLGATATPNIEVNIDGIECFPRLSAAAFGPDGDLWVSSTCATRVVRLAQHELAAGGLVTPSIVLSGVTSPSSLAFDGDGNLWSGD